MRHFRHLFKSSKCKVKTLLFESKLILTDNAKVSDVKILSKKIVLENKII